MGEYENLFTVSRVTDTETSYQYIGEIEGAFPDDKLEKYLKQFGEKGKTNLLEHFAFLQHQVWNKWLEMKRKESQGQTASSGSGSV